MRAVKDVPTAEARVDFKSACSSPKLFPKIEITDGAMGVIGGKTSLKGQGESVGALLGSADGQLRVGHVGRRNQRIAAGRHGSRWGKAHEAFVHRG